MDPDSRVGISYLRRPCYTAAAEILATDVGKEHVSLLLLVSPSVNHSPPLSGPAHRAAITQKSPAFLSKQRMALLSQPCALSDGKGERQPRWKWFRSLGRIHIASSLRVCGTPLPLLRRLACGWAASDAHGCSTQPAMSLVGLHLPVPPRFSLAVAPSQRPQLSLTCDSVRKRGCPVLPAHLGQVCAEGFLYSRSLCP